MVKDLKGYREKTDGKARFPGWFVLVVSHTVILVVGVSLGHWMGKRFANTSSPQRTVSQQLESRNDKTTESGSTEEKTVPDAVAGRDETGESRPTSSTIQEKEPRFTFYETLQRESVSERERPVGGDESRNTEAAEKPNLAKREIPTEPKQPIGESTSLVFYVQVASFREKERARKYAEHLKGRGHPAKVVSKVIPNKGIWHRVRMGPFENATEAKGKAEAIKESEGLTPFIQSEERGENR